MTEDPRDHRDDPNDAATDSELDPVSSTADALPADSPRDDAPDETRPNDRASAETQSVDEPHPGDVPSDDPFAEGADPLFDDDDPLGPPPAAMYDDPPPPQGSATDASRTPSDAPFEDRPTPPRATQPPQSGPTPAPSYMPMPAPDAQSVSSESRNLAALAHLSAFAGFVGIPPFVGPLVIWLLQKDRNAFVAESAKEALNFNLSLLIYGIAAVVLAIVTVGLGLIVVVPLALVAVVVWLVVTVLAAVRVSNGRMYRYPLTIRLVS